MQATLNARLWWAALETVYMVGASGMMALVMGVPLGALLFVTGDSRFGAHRGWYHAMSLLVNMGRSLPFVILMILVIPLSKWLLGTSIGTHAALVPLSLAAIPFMGRVVENALMEVDSGVTEVMFSLGATPWQSIRYGLLVEAWPAILSGWILTLVNLVGYSAMAGTLGGGGLGKLAVDYGYKRFDSDVMLWTVVILFLMVQMLEWLGRVIRTWQPRTRQQAVQ